MTTRSGSSQSRWLAIATALAAMAIALVGFGASLAAAGGMTPAKTGAVSIKGFAFHAGTTRVKKGTTVTFRNRDSVTHTATGAAFNTGRIAPGKTKSVTFKKKGTFPFHCSIHQFMHGKVVVE